MISLGLLAATALAVGYWLRARHQRQATWRELCLRLELVSEPGDARVGMGKWKGVRFRLRDTGSDWLLAVQLSRTLLPRGVVLFSVWKLRPTGGLRPLRLLWSLPRAPPSTGLSWCTDLSRPPSVVEVSLPFLEEARRAVEVHGPLRVESHQLVHTLRAGSLVSVNEVRTAVEALDATAQRWLDVVEKHGPVLVTERPPRSGGGHGRWSIAEDDGPGWRGGGDSGGYS